MAAIQTNDLTPTITEPELNTSSCQCNTSCACKRRLVNKPGDKYQTTANKCSSSNSTTVCSSQSNCCCSKGSGCKL